ncbi:hypothetical protein F4678DRAFT_463504 [Xylaria arbuscula]|nr:hypothetical protein F4678DRAFT_463504 [Xylaria arbuscula]
MSGWKDVVKNGWHPEKSGSSITSSVKGLVGRGDPSSSSSNREEHVVTPRSALRDPSSFGPPPKHVAAYGPTPTAQQQQTQATQAGSRTYNTTQPYSSQTQYGGGRGEVVEEEAPPPEPKPYRVDTTGLSTSHLPPPPRRYGNGQQSPQPSPAARPKPAIATTQPSVVAAKSKVPPSLPPRLPPRSGNSTPTPSPTSADAQAANQGHLPQGAVNRLGAAGISVPGFGIGGGGTASPTTQAPTLGYSQTEELQTRFARMGTPSSSSPVSSQGIGQVPSVLGKKKPPPPPSKSKKPGLPGDGENADAPPPIPLGTRPRFA